MRLRVDTRGGWASFDVADEDRAWEYYHEHGGLRIRLCENIMDDGGIVLAGVPLDVDLTKWEDA